MEFAPLNYLLDSLTIWHLGIWIGLTIIFEVVVRKKSNLSVSFLHTLLTALLLASAYGLFAVLLGQVFGDKYAAAELWPSGLILGGLFSSIAFLDRLIPEQQKEAPIWFAIFGVTIGANFYAFGLWLLPRVVGLGLIDFPRVSWACSYRLVPARKGQIGHIPALSKRSLRLFWRLRPRALTYGPYRLEAITGEQT